MRDTGRLKFLSKKMTLNGVGVEIMLFGQMVEETADFQQLTLHISCVCA